MDRSVSAQVADALAAGARRVATLLPWAENEKTGPLVIDRASLLDGCLILCGWVGGPALPRLHFRGRPHPRVSVAPVDRPDAVPPQGCGAVRGFRLAVALNADERPEDFRLVLGPLGATLTDVATVRGLAPSETHFRSLSARLVAAITPERPTVLEIGSRARSGGSYRHLFPPCAQVTGLDIAPGPGVDIVGDAHDMARFLPRRYGSIFSVSVFEHLLMPWKVAVEMARVLEPGGLAFIQSHAAWPLHDEPWDFLRFSREAWHGLFNAATGFEVVDTAYAMEASVVPLIAEAGPLTGLAEQRTLLLSACLVRKVAEPTVTWDCDPSAIYDLSYTHGSRV